MPSCLYAAMSTSSISPSVLGEMFRSRFELCPTVLRYEFCSVVRLLTLVVVFGYQTQQPLEPESAGSPPGAQQSAVRMQVSASAGAQV